MDLIPSRSVRVMLIMLSIAVIRAVWVLSKTIRSFKKLQPVFHWQKRNLISQVNGSTFHHTSRHPLNRVVATRSQVFLHPLTRETFACHFQDGLTNTKLLVF